MKTEKCCVVLCERKVVKEEKITYRCGHGTIITTNIYFCDQCKIDDIFKEVTSEMKLRDGGY